MSRNLCNELTDDARIFHREGLELDSVASAVDASFKDGVMTVRLRLDSGRRMSVSVEGVATGILRLKAWRGRVKFQETSPMLEPRAGDRPKASFRKTKGAFAMTAGGVTFRVGRSPFSAAMLDGRGRVLWQLECENRAAGGHVTPPLGYRRSDKAEQPFLSWRIRNDERLFGMGEKFNKVEKTGTRATIWTADTCGLNTSDLAYMSVPVLFSTRGWGMMLHSSFRSFWEIGNFSYAAGSFLTEDDKIDLFLFAAPTLKALLGRYTALTGRPKMPPKWTFGVWMSRCAYKTRTELEAAAFGMRKRNIPCDVIHFDPPWMKTHWYPVYGVDACDFEWNDKDFPGRDGLFAKLSDAYISSCMWINPYIPEGTRIYAEAKEKGYLVRAASGRPARNEMSQRVGITDFTNPEAKEWWKGHLKELLRAGAAVFKPDYGERVPEDCIFHNGRTGAEMHNLYLLLYCQAVYEATREEAGYGAIWGRSGYIGSQRYPGTWAGDTEISWEAMKCCLRGGLSAGMTGIGFWSHDIGGFVGPKAPSPELYVRWAQCGLLSPWARFHGNQPREPWRYGKEAEKIVTRWIRLRYRLIPYLLAAAEQHCRTGVPIMRHMALEFPGEPNADTLDDQYMLGPDLLVAPVMTPGTRSRQVYLPRGIWTDLHNAGRCYEGPGFRELRAPLSRMPVLVREGAIIPKLTGNPQHLKDGPARRLAVDIYPGPGTRTVVFKDGDVRVRLKREARAGCVVLTAAPAPVRLKVRFVGVSKGRISCSRADARCKVARSGTEVQVDAREGVEIRII